MSAAVLVAALVFTMTDNSDAQQTITRSEEHPSELQSLPKIVCRLLLEKKTIIMQ